MTKDTTSTVTWQKIAVLAAIVVVVLPVVAGFAWKVIFPKNYLLYNDSPIITAANIDIGAVTVINAGSATQTNITFYLPTQYIDPKHTFIAISTPSRSLGYAFSADPESPLTQFKSSNGIQINLGTIQPDEKIRLTFKQVKPNGVFLSQLSFLGLHIESAQTVAIEADGTPRPAFAEDIHSLYMDAAPYFLALIASILALFIAVAVIYEAFFDTTQSKMTRLWKQMDILQEKIDKERRYK